MYEAARSSPDPEALPLRLRAERDFSELLVLLLRLGDDFRQAAQGEPELLLGLVERARAAKRPERFGRFLAACSALWPPVATEGAKNLRLTLAEVEKVGADSLQAEGLRGAELGRELRRRRLGAIRQSLARET
jgi:hypothetical protein